MRTSTCAAVAFVTALALVQSPAAAGDRPFRVAVAAKSSSDGLAGETVRSIKRLPGRGRDAVMADVLGRFISVEEAERARRVSSEQSSIVVGASGKWLVEVRGTGEWVRFFNDGYISGPLNQPISKLARPSGDDLEVAGRQLIQNQLAPFVRLGLGEDIQGWSVSYLMNGSTYASGAIMDSVVASRILFTRVIDGVPVLGPGNKVSVTVANDGTLVGFDLDWPDLARGDSTLATIGIAAIRTEENAELGLTPGKAWPLEKMFECGYYDPGVAGLSAGSSLVPACVAAADSGSGPWLTVVIPCAAR